MTEGFSQPTGVETMVPLCAVFRRFLKGQGLKFTPERARILAAVLDKEGVFEAETLLEEVRAAGYRISKATIYRTLKHLVDANIISEELIDSKQTHYRLSIGQEPRGILTCVETGRIVEFNAPELSELRDRICRENGFEPVSVRLVVYGVSPEAKDE